jgi:hypothetical protein
VESEKELENLFNSLILRLRPDKERRDCAQDDVQRAFRGELVG